MKHSDCVTRASNRAVRRVTVAAVAVSTVGASSWLAVSAFAAPAGTNLVISEAYVNGGSAGASYVNKFVELYNPTSSPIALSGDTLQYRAPTSTVTPSGAQVFALAGTVAPHGHFLIQLPSNAANGAALPTPDLAAPSTRPSRRTRSTASRARSTTCSPMPPHGRW